MTDELLKKAFSEENIKKSLSEIGRERTIERISSMSDEEMLEATGGGIPFNEEDMTTPDSEYKK